MGIWQFGHWNLLKHSVQTVELSLADGPGVPHKRIGDVILPSWLNTESLFDLLVIPAPEMGWDWWDGWHAIKNTGILLTPQNKNSENKGFYKPYEQMDDLGVATYFWVDTQMGKVFINTQTF